MSRESDISKDVITEILSTGTESVPDLITDLMTRHELSSVMHELNTKLLSNDSSARNSAQAALTHLGFI